MQQFEAHMASLSVQPGDVILGKYRIERVIGVGGMGAVVAARHLQLDEPVAIKFVLPTMLVHEEIVHRFIREARATIKIRSEHCVRVLDVGTLETGVPYMVMEYLPGRDLAAVLKMGRPSIADAVDWVLQAGEALAEAHTLGIVHRDLKPANLFLTQRPDGSHCVKVLDFGISKQAVGVGDAAVTATQALLGSPRYMSPEQMRSSRDVDARSDVWALGTVLHELVGGQPPFQADTMTALCAMILQDPPASLRLARPDAPGGLETAILGALEKDRNRRYPSVAEFAFAVARYGTPAARASAERIARILGARTSTLPALVPAGAGTEARIDTMTVLPEVGATPPPISRSVAMARGGPSRGRWIVLGALVALACIGVAWGVANHGSRVESAAPASVSAPAPAPPPVPEPAPAASPTALTTTSAPPESMAPPAGAIPLGPPGAPADTAHANTPREHKAHPGPEPHRPAVGAPSATPAPPSVRPGSAPADPFGEDRKG